MNDDIPSRLLDRATALRARAAELLTAAVEHEAAAELVREIVSAADGDEVRVRSARPSATTSPRDVGSTTPTKPDTMRADAMLAALQPGTYLIKDIRARCEMSSRQAWGALNAARRMGRARMDKSGVWTIIGQPED